METDRSKYLNRKIVGGKPYLFFRYKGALTALPTDETSDEFKAAYDSALRQTKVAAAVAPVVPLKASGSLLAGIDVYVNSFAFTKVKPRTKKQYLHTIDQIKAHRIARGPLDELTTGIVNRYTDEIAVAHGASVADAHKSMLNNIWTECADHEQFGLDEKSNPTRDAKKRYEVKNRHRPWSDEMIEAFMRAAPPNLKLACLLLRFTTQRGSDGIAVKWSDYVEREDADGKPIMCLLFRQQKTNGEADPLPLAIPCVRPLRDALDRRLHSGEPLADTILTDMNGEPWAEANSLSKAITRLLRKLGFAGSMHGLRARGATDIANCGGGVDGVKSFTGHSSDDQAAYYAQDHDRRVMSTKMMRALDAKLENDARKKLRVVG